MPVQAYLIFQVGLSKTETDDNLGLKRLGGRNYGGHFLRGGGSDLEGHHVKVAVALLLIFRLYAMIIVLLNENDFNQLQ